MHEISLHQTITDYVSGETIEDTTFEDLRQAIARILVEQRGYPKDQLRTKVSLAYAVDGQPFVKILDLIALDPLGHPVLLVMFCPGGLISYVRQYVAAARLFPQGPVPMLVVTDSKEAKLVRVRDGEVIREGFHAFPTWKELLDLAGTFPCERLDAERKEREERILYAMSNVSGPCGR
ncbi:MAG: type I restriction endonuclease subunit R [Deltaproteobacteria bacterium]|nr:MAG: type I restriction endonuclease subunit R [Deltaproteobacteria bacterium]